MGNIIHRIFGKNTQPPQPVKPATLSPTDLTIAKLKQAQDKLLLQKKNLAKNADKAEKEAKDFVLTGHRERAFFSLKRKKLYGEYLQQTESQLTHIQKTILEVEAASLTADMVSVLKDSNDLLNKLDQSNKLENIVMDMKERDTNQEKFVQLFNEYNIEDDSVDILFKQFEAEVKGEQVEEIVYQPPVHNHIQQQKEVVKVEEVYVNEDDGMNVSNQEYKEDMNKSVKSEHNEEEEDMAAQLQSLAN